MTSRSSSNNTTRKSDEESAEGISITKVLLIHLFAPIVLMYIAAYTGRFSSWVPPPGRVGTEIEGMNLNNGRYQSKVRDDRVPQNQPIGDIDNMTEEELLRVSERLFQKDYDAQNLKDGESYKQKYEPYHIKFVTGRKWRDHPRRGLFEKTYIPETDEKILEIRAQIDNLPDKYPPYWHWHLAQAHADRRKLHPLGDRDIIDALANYEETIEYMESTGNLDYMCMTLGMMINTLDGDDMVIEALEVDNFMEESGYCKDFNQFARMRIERAGRLSYVGREKEAFGILLEIFDLFRDDPVTLSRALKRLEGFEFDSDNIPGGWEFIVRQAKHILSLPGVKNTSSDGRMVEAWAIAHLAIAKYYEKVENNFDKAFEYIQLAMNKPKLHVIQTLQSSPYNSEMVEQSVQWYGPNKGAFEVAKQFGMQDSGHVFVMGFPRSGTSLTETILAAHPRVGSVSENGEVGRWFDKMQQAFLELFEKSNQEAVEKYQLTARQIEKVTFDRLETVYGKSSYKRIVDKSMYYPMHLGLITSFFPGSKIINIVRDPMDVLFSNYKNSFGGEAFTFTNSFDTLAEVYKNYRKMMEFWEEYLPSNSIIHIRYDDLTNDFENVARALVTYVGLEWTDTILRFYEQNNVMKTQSVSQVRQPIYTTSTQKWRKYEKQLQPLLDMLGEYAEFQQPTTLPGYNVRSSSSIDEL